MSLLKAFFLCGVMVVPAIPAWMIPPIETDLEKIAAKVTDDPYNLEDVTRLRMMRGGRVEVYVVEVNDDNTTLKWWGLEPITWCMEHDWIQHIDAETIHPVYDWVTGREIRGFDKKEE